MPIQSSFATVSDQIILFNKNVIEVLAAINSLATTQDPNVTVNVYSDQGIVSTYNLPSYAFLKNEIDRLNRSLNSLYSVDNPNGTMIQPTSKNKFKKLVTVDLNREPNSATSLGIINQFTSDEDYFLDSLLNPQLNIELDLTGNIDNTVSQVLSQRFIVNFEVDTTNTLTTFGSSARTSFNQLYNGNSKIDYQSFLTWYSTTPGILNPLNPSYDQNIYNLEPNSLLYSGLFTAQSTYLDQLNRKLWYNLPSLAYTVNLTGEVLNLKVGDQLIVNIDQTASTRFQIIEINTAASNPQIRLETIEGNQPVPVGIAGGLKIYSPVLYTKKVKIPIGYNEYCVVFIKPLNNNTNLLSKNWSSGTGFFTNNLTLNQSGPDNGKSFETYYINSVDDYGQVLRDLVIKSKPSQYGQAPNPPSLDQSSFKVVQTNTHLTDTPDSKTLKTLSNSQTSLSAQVQQLNQAILDRNKKLKITRFTSSAQQQQYQLELTNLQNQKVAAANLLDSTTQQITNLANSPSTNVNPEFALRGFFNFPDPIQTNGTLPQQTIGFVIWYRKLSKDGTEPQVSTYPLTTASSSVTAAFSNWIEIKTPVLNRVFDPTTNTWSWQQPSVTSADQPNVNQLDIPIKPNEQIEFKIKSISEVGYPDAPLESDWSQPLTIAFPDSLNNTINQTATITTNAHAQSLKSSIKSDLTAQGLDELLSQKAMVNNQTFFLNDKGVLTSFKDANGNAIGLFDQLQAMITRITTLEEIISQSQGILQISIFRNNQQFIVNNGSETTFNVECEDYLDPFTDSGIPTGRVYQNNVYTIKDFVVKISNVATASTLGLLSNLNYFGNSQIYNNSVPQVFWVNNQDELIASNATGQTTTQLDNQFIWSINYDTVNQATVTSLAQNIGNNFISAGNNCLTGVLSTPEFSLGYGESSILNFVSNNISLLDPSKWIDTSITVGSTNKFLTTIHPVVSDLTTIQETSYDKVKVLSPGDQNAIVIPLNIYFKLNALDTTQTGVNYQYINLNNATQTVQHIKEVKFYLQNQSSNQPFIFSMVFNLNRNKINVKKNLSYTTIVK